MGIACSMHYRKHILEKRPLACNEKKAWETAQVCDNIKMCFKETLNWTYMAHFSYRLLHPERWLWPVCLLKTESRLKNSLPKRVHFVGVYSESCPKS